MTIEDAIKHLQFSKKSYQNLIDNDTRSGDAIGKDIHGIWSADTSLVKAYQTMIDTMDMAIASLEAWEKVKAEIDEQYDRVHPYNISCAEGLEMALGIIDKHLQEISETETWSGFHGQQIIAPKGTFDKIYNAPDEEDDDI